MPAGLLLKCFHAYKTGRVTVIGLEGRSLEEPDSIEEIRDGLLQLVNSHHCEILVVDLTDVCVMSSWILGILAAVQGRGTSVELYHPSPEMREILATTHLDRYLHVRDTI